MHVLDADLSARMAKSFGYYIRALPEHAGPWKESYGVWSKTFVPGLCQLRQTLQCGYGLTLVSSRNPDTFMQLCVI